MRRSVSRWPGFQVRSGLGQQLQEQVVADAAMAVTSVRHTAEQQAVQLLNLRRVLACFLPRVSAGAPVAGTGAPAGQFPEHHFDLLVTLSQELW